MIFLILVLLLWAPACDRGGGEVELDPLDLSTWGEGEDLTPGRQDSRSDPDTPATVDAGPEPGAACGAPADDALRIYFSRNALDYQGDGTLCAGQNLGLRAGELIRAAESSVDLAGMTVQDDKVVDALVDAADAGIAVRVFLDDGYHQPDDFDGLKRLVQAGVDLFHDGPATALMHNKFMVVDEHWVWTGSANFTYYGAVSNANAVGLFDSPALAQIYGDRFDRLWGDGVSHGTGDAHEWQEGNPAMATVGGVPVEVWFTPNWDAVGRLVELIEGAEESIHFEIFAFTLDSVRAALDSRCGEVELVGLYDEEQDRQGSSVASDPWCADALILPGKLLGTVGYKKLHHKLLIVDGDTVAFGSMNWSVSGATENDENLVVLSDPDVAGLFEAEFATRLSEAAGQ